MKTNVYTYLLICLSFGQIFSQELRPMPFDLDAITSKAIDFNFEEDLHSELFSVMKISDMYTLQILNYEQDNFYITINSRLEEELPYEDSNYDYSAFYYLDLGVNYAINDFNLSVSIDNFLNPMSNDFSIDPIRETSNGLIDSFYFSHESDVLLKFIINYSF